MTQEGSGDLKILWSRKEDFRMLTKDKEQRAKRREGIWKGCPHTEGAFRCTRHKPNMFSVLRGTYTQEWSCC
jgi:hypothetical protein